jgi:thiosulfate/3-mercaptopyruvate sulfurtransferase
MLMICGVMLSATGVSGDPNGYPRPELLIEPAELAKPEVARRFVVLDARARKAFEEGRIPAARWLDAAAWEKAFGDGQDAEGWGKRIGELGIALGAPVVIYDDALAKDAARIWWILRFWGVRDVRLLNGGWSGWKAAGLPIETGPPMATPTVAFTPRPMTKRLATKDQVLASLEQHSLQIVDARSQGEYCGTEKLKNQRGGRVPGARHLDWTDLLDQQTKRFKSPEELRKLLAQAGIDLASPTATYCQSGGRASVMAFTLELMGADRVSNYYRSWAEWGNAADTPVDADENK